VFAMATFVDTSSEEEQITTLVLYVSNLKKKKDPEGESSTQFSNECTRLVQEGRTKDVILKLVSETDTIFSDTNEKGMKYFITYYYSHYNIHSPIFHYSIQFSGLNLYSLYCKLYFDISLSFLCSNLTHSIYCILHLFF
jgi:hypothetical protein